MTSASGATLPIVLDALQKLPHEILLQGLDHLRLPDVEPQLPDLFHLLGGLHRQGAIGELRVAQLLLLDVLGVEIEVELVQVVDTATELLPAVMITAQ